MYNPSNVGKKGTLFGLPYSLKESNLVLLPIPLDITTSHTAGTCHAPDLIMKESPQLDLALPSVHHPWLLKMTMNPPPINKKENHKYRQHAETIIQHLENGGDTPEILNHLDIVNTFCAKTHKKIKQKCEELLNIGKKVAIIGGDHSSPLGLINALSKTTPFGILHIDAHMDLRKNYQGFTHSHASIMYHACQLNSVQSLTQIGIRDYCQEEENYAQQSKKPIQIFYDEQIYKDKLSGKSWQQIVQSIIDTLPEKIYISFDIDGLIPSLCPKTGTPVPGGLTFNDATYIIEKVAKSGKKIIGFDLCETGNGQWDANVAARIIYRLAISMGITQKILNFK